MTELQEATVPVARDVDDNLHLIARDPAEMGIAQQKLSQWFAAKAEILARDADEVSQSQEIANKNGWPVAKTLARQAQLLRRRVDFYTKCKAAVDAGYCIVPNFDVDVFAIRTNRARPTSGYSTNRASTERARESEGPAAGEGALVSSFPISVPSHTEPRTNSWGDPIKDSSGKVEREQVFRASEWNDEIDFPISVARPEIMTETARAMALEIFDEFGVQEGTKRQARTGPVKGDPIVVARMIDPRGSQFNRRFVTFLIAWYVNTKDL